LRAVKGKTQQTIGKARSAAKSRLAEPRRSGRAVRSRAGGHGGGGNQQGLINLYVADNTVQVPIGIAANICGVAANILAQDAKTGDANCDALGNATAGG